MGVMEMAVGCDGSQCSNQANVWVADAASQREWVYNSLCCGTWQGLPYNFATDIFTLIGREQTTLATAQNPCPAGCTRSH